MKTFRIIPLLLCVCILGSCVNNQVRENLLYSAIQKAKSSGETFNQISVLSLMDKSASQREKSQEHFLIPQEVYFLQYDNSVLSNLSTSLSLVLPLGDKDLQLELLENPIDYLVTTSDNEEILPDKNIRHYHGIVKGDPCSIVAITFTENEIIGLVATDEGKILVEG